MEVEVQEAVQEVILERTDFCSRSAGDSMEECHDMFDREGGYSHNSGVAEGTTVVGFAGLGCSNFDQDKRTWWATMQNLCRYSSVSLQNAHLLRFVPANGNSSVTTRENVI